MYGRVTAWGVFTKGETVRGSGARSGCAARVSFMYRRRGGFGVGVYMMGLPLYEDDMLENVCFGYEQPPRSILTSCGSERRASSTGWVKGRLGWKRKKLYAVRGIYIAVFGEATYTSRGNTSS